MGTAWFYRGVVVYGWTLEAALAEGWCRIADHASTESRLPADETGRVIMRREEVGAAALR
jgi:hypothetical protein